MALRPTPYGNVVASKTSSTKALRSRGVRPNLASRSEFRPHASAAATGSAIPLCRWPFPRLCGFSCAGCTGSGQTPGHTLSSSSAIRRRIAQRKLAERPQPPAPLMGFWSLQHMQHARIHDSRARHARFVPPAGFGCPLGGLLSAHAGRAYFIPAALMGFALRSILLVSGIRRVSAEKSPHTVFPVVLSGRSLAEARVAVVRAGPTGRGSWVLTRWRVPGRRQRINSPESGGSLGISLSGLAGRDLRRISPAVRSHA